MGFTKELMFESMRRGHAAREQFVCGKCLNDDALAAFVRDNAMQTECDFCGNERSVPFAASLGDVIEHMEQCIAADYTDPAGELPYETREGGYQGEVFDARDLLEDIGFEPESDDLFDEVVAAFNDQQWCRDNYFSLTASERLQFGWDGFKRLVKHARRFTFWSVKDDGPEFDEGRVPVGNMLSIIGACVTEAELIRTLPKGTPIWRVRVHGPKDVLAEDHQLSAPPIERAIQSNRMSPAGVVMFYGAEDFETACLETVDPTKAPGNRVTGGAFQTARNLRLLDLVDLPGMPSFFQLGSSDFRNMLSFLRQFAADLAVPVVRDGREHIEYVPTQAFTEYVRFELRLGDDASVDGIRYRSAVNGQPCYVLFCTQDECVAVPRGYGKPERWLEFDPGSVRTADAEQAAPRAAGDVIDGNARGAD